MSYHIETFEDKPINALELNQFAKEKALSIYHTHYNERLSDIIPSYRCIFPDEVFIKILNDLISLSQQRIEDRLINTKIIFINNEMYKFGCPNGFKHISLKRKTFNCLDLSNLKKFLEMASDSNCFLLIGVSNEKSDENLFCLNGFIYVDVSMNSFISKFVRSKNFIKKEGILTINEDKFIRKLKFTVNSIFCKIKNGEIELSYFDKTFLKISKGTLFEPISNILDIEQIFLFSTQFYKKLISYDREDLRKISPCCLIENWDSYNTDSIVGFERYHHIYCIALNSLNEILLRISDAHHGSTIIFGFKGDINNEKIFQPDAIKVHIPYGDSFLEIWKDDEKAQEILESKEELIISQKEQKILQTIKTYEDAIVSLSKTDGAMIFDSNLNLISVGTFFKVRDSATSFSSSGGARLKSAEGFIESNKDSIAFVVSQDGSIHFIRKNYTQGNL